MDVVISLGGSIIIPDQIDAKFLLEFRELMLDFVKKGNRAVIVTGGGKVCRRYQDAAKELNPSASKEDLDWIGIKSTKLNAELMRVVFGEHAYESVIDNPTEPIKTEKKIIIGSGWKPGCSTDKDTVLLAVNFGIKNIANLSNIEYVYDRDPKKFPDAKKIEKMSWDEMKEIVGDEWIPGKNAPFDPHATNQAAEHKMRVVIMNGTDIPNLKRFLEGKEFKGTVIE